MFIVLFCSRRLIGGVGSRDCIVDDDDDDGMEDEGGIVMICRMIPV